MFAVVVVAGTVAKYERMVIIPAINQKKVVKLSTCLLDRNTYFLKKNARKLLVNWNKLKEKKTYAL